MDCHKRSKYLEVHQVLKKEHASYFRGDFEVKPSRNIFQQVIWSIHLYLHLLLLLLFFWFGGLFYSQMTAHFGSNLLELKGAGSIIKMPLANHTQQVRIIHPSIHHFNTMSNGIVQLFKLFDKQTIYQLLSLGTFKANFLTP